MSKRFFRHLRAALALLAFAGPAVAQSTHEEELQDLEIAQQLAAATWVLFEDQERQFENPLWIRGAGGLAFVVDGDRMEDQLRGLVYVARTTGLADEALQRLPFYQTLTFLSQDRARLDAAADDYIFTVLMDQMRRASAEIRRETEAEIDGVLIQIAEEIDALRRTETARIADAAGFAVMWSEGMSGWRAEPGTVEPRDGGIYLAAPSDDAYSYFIAPSEFYSDWVGLTEISFELKSWGGDYTDNGVDGDIYLRNGDMRAAYMIDVSHTETWETILVPLSGSGWRLTGGATSLNDVLANITGFEIRAEYGYGDDFTQIRELVIR